ncbi:MAG: alpha/beta hydrolase, partial [Bacteroidetes bacterium]
LYIFQERIFFLPQYLEDDYIFRYSDSFEEIYIENNNKDDKLHALWFKNKQKKSEKVILYFHGNGGSLDSWGSISNNFTKLGYDILMIDYRTYGKSRGKLSEKKLFNDAKLSFQFLKNHYQEQNMTIYGRSIGTGIATYLASETKPKRLILETPYYNFHSLVTHHAPILPAFLLLRYSFSSNKYLKKVSCPVYIFHGTEDKTIPYKFGKQLANAIPAQNFITIEYGNHNNLSSYPYYQQKLKEILD